MKEKKYYVGLHMDVDFDYLREMLADSGSTIDEWVAVNKNFFEDIGRYYRGGQSKSLRFHTYTSRKFK